MVQAPKDYETLLRLYNEVRSALAFIAVHEVDRLPGDDASLTVGRAASYSSLKRVAVKSLERADAIWSPD